MSDLDWLYDLEGEKPGSVFDSGEALHEVMLDDDEGEDMARVSMDVALAGELAALRPPDPGALEETWVLLGDEESDMSQVYEDAGTSLDKFFEKYKLYPINIDEQRKLFIARYGNPQFGYQIPYDEAKLEKCPTAIGFVDFLCGFPMKAPEMLVVIGEYASRLDEVSAAHEDYAYPLPAFPEDFFEGYALDKTLLNIFYLDEDHAETMADDLGGEPKPTGLHWWTRINFKPESKYPVPGEFFALGYRQWVTLPSFSQESNPMLFAGNWIDTVYYTGGIIKQIDESGDYPLYKVEWRKKTYEVAPTDFATYQVGDRVTILKTVPNNKMAQLWKDEDTRTFDAEKWVLAPIMFYGISGKQKESVEE